MKKLTIFLIVGLFFFMSGHLFSQKLKSGDLSVLKGQKVINFTYDFSNTSVGKFKTEAEYIKKGTDDRNGKKPGAGDEWAVKWNADKAGRYQPAFEKEFDKYAGDCGLEGEPDPGAKYTFIIHTNFIEQGVETVVMGTAKSAAVDLVIDLVETAAPEKILATIEMEGAKPHTSMSMGFGGVPVNREVYDPGARITECYQTAGKQIGKLICKQLK